MLDVKLTLDRLLRLARLVMCRGSQRGPLGLGPGSPGPLEPAVFKGGLPLPADQQEREIRTDLANPLTDPPQRSSISNPPNPHQIRAIRYAPSRQAPKLKAREALRLEKKIKRLTKDYKTEMLKVERARGNDREGDDDDGACAEGGRAPAKAAECVRMSHGAAGAALAG